MRRLDRRWWVAIGVAVVALSALALSRSGLFGPSAEECRPVNDILDFNRAQAEQIAAKTRDAEGIPNIAEEGAYQAWADGLAERTQNVHDPELARDATQLAALANEFVGKISEVRSEAQGRAPGAPPPPAVFQMDLLNNQITETLKKLSDACG
ncbi:hypothetical protein [Mycobacterium sp. 1274761.0]|uniref:hypothetical protein n=1 Tax=Mycobacterium sp. 1274761.0 TaxID=1834077 RepID=UPI0007FE941C|nr:hypothetical protein [Mycobacterium sp. 1274761.0]OBK80164.1 hypothetical protein A5651_00160 [Mycobacterium sp. 1274761.0]